MLKHILEFKNNRFLKEYYFDTLAYSCENYYIAVHWFCVRGWRFLSKFL